MGRRQRRRKPNLLFQGTHLSHKWSVYYSSINSQISKGFWILPWWILVSFIACLSHIQLLHIFPANRAHTGSFSSPASLRGVANEGKYWKDVEQRHSSQIDQRLAEGSWFKGRQVLALVLLLPCQCMNMGKSFKLWFVDSFHKGVEFSGFARPLARPGALEECLVINLAICPSGVWTHLSSFLSGRGHTAWEVGQVV